ncbi:CinA family protein, partial [Microbacterium sp. GbtcB4]|uniref:CinA family protein n=1 Tax=Microbacterium sp. GbtcB4 TaxID=2824749 RepID=UPI001C30699D
MSDTTPAEALDALRERGWTLGVAESHTGGAVCAALVAVPGASAVLLGGDVAYATPVKHTLLGGGTDLVERYGAV